MYQVSENYLNKIYLDSTKHVLNVYLNGNKIDSKYILGCTPFGNVFSEESFDLGSTPSINLELKLHNNALSNDKITRVYIESGIEEEIVPIGYFNINCIKEDDDTTIFTLEDDMIKLDFPYDGSKLINKKGYATLLEVWLDICDTFGVIPGTISFLGQDVKIAVYDNSINAREYIGYIAAQAGGFAIIGRDGKLYIRKIGENVIEYPKRNLKQGFKFGNRFKVSRVKYEDGVQDFCAGEDTENTIYISQDNPYITSQEQIDSIYNLYNALELYGFSGSGIIDPAIDVGDIIIIDGKKTVYQGSMTYAGKFITNISFDVQNKQQEESTSRQISQVAFNRIIRSRINQINGIIETMVKAQDEYSESMSLLEQELNRIGLSVEDIVNLTRTKTQVKNLNIKDIRTGEGYITKFVVKGNTEYFTSNEVTIVASKAARGTNEKLLTEDGEELLTEDGQNLITENRTMYMACQRVTLDDVLRNYTLNEVEYFDELQVLQDGTIQVVRRIGVDEEGNLYLLNKEEITTLDEKLILPSNEGSSYYFIEELNNLTYEGEYIVKSEYSDYLATKAEVRAGLEVKVDVNKLISEINASADIIRLIGQRLIIQMENYSLNENGFMKAIAGEIAGFNMSENSFSKDISTTYKITSDDVVLALAYLNDLCTLPQELINLYDVNKDGTLNVVDVISLINAANGNLDYSPLISGKIKIDSVNAKKSVLIQSLSGNLESSLSMFYGFMSMLRTNILLVGNQLGTSFTGICIDANKKMITVTDGSSSTEIKPTAVESQAFNNNSLAELKKNITKLDDVLEIVKNSDIYQFNYKNEDDSHSKHYGFVIGENCRTPKEVITDDRTAINTYSMISILWKAVQELSNEVDKLKGDK